MSSRQRVRGRSAAGAVREKPVSRCCRALPAAAKTLVYIRLAQELLRQGRSVMILVPEIALTPQMMARFTAYFGDEVALLHSGLRMTERYDQYQAYPPRRWPASCWVLVRRCLHRWAILGSSSWTRSRKAPTNRRRRPATMPGTSPSTVAYRRGQGSFWALPPQRWRRPTGRKRAIIRRRCCGSATTGRRCRAVILADHAPGAAGGAERHHQPSAVR